MMYIIAENDKAEKAREEKRAREAKNKKR